jgi:RNA 3'-terminal phosphate cyclase (ATP)
MIEIDGSQGEGGGQILRTSLSLAACLGKSVHIRNIRQGRKKPGLMRQHLACVNAIKKVSNATVKGASLGSTAIEFIPSEIQAGDYHFSVGSAGSSTLVFQTVLPALLLADSPSSLTLEGGTHNPMAPSYDFIKFTFLPVLKQLGIKFKVKIERYGFYPVGAGHWTIDITPPTVFSRLKLEQREQLLNAEAVCISAGIPGHVLEREKKQLLRRLDWSEKSITTTTVKSLGAGNMVMLKAHYPKVTEVVDSIGSVGVSAERVADNAVSLLQRYQDSGAPVGRYLADQLLLPLAIGGGGSFVTGPLSEHCRTNIAVIKQMMGVEIKTQQIEGKRKWRIRI